MRILKEHAPSVLLVVLMLLFVAYPLAELGERMAMKYLLDGLLIVVLIAALFAERGRFSFRHPGVYAIGAAVVLRFLATNPGSRFGADVHRALLICTEIYTSLLMFCFCFMILRSVTSKPAVTGDTIAGAAAVYILLALAFGGLHVSSYLLDPDAFSNTGLPHPDALAAGDSTLRAFGATFTYYSVVTQTTLGYGDITPKSSLVRGLAMVQTIVGQLYLAILLARLVAMELGQRDRAQRD